MSDKALAIAKLNQKLPTLPTKDQTFANSLITQFVAKGTLSEKQWYWVAKLIERKKPEDAKPELQVGDFAGVIALFERAKKHLKYPAIKLQADGAPIRLAMAGPNSQYAGCILVNDGGPYGSGKWYGRVTPDGSWKPGYAATEEMMVSLSVLLTVLATDPAGVAAHYGKLTGACCFCSTPLTDPKSVVMGYGPTCAKNYGLPWGEVFEKPAAQIAVEKLTGKHFATNEPLTA